MPFPKHITVVAPVCSPPKVLSAFLAGLERLESGDARLDYVFVDDNEDGESSDRLRAWARERPATVLPAPARLEAYVCDDHTHHWTTTLVARVAALKDRAIETALRGDCDAVFFVDADLVVQPSTLRVLGSAEVDIVAEVFWTFAGHDQLERANVWASDVYSMVPARLIGAPEAEREEAGSRFLARLLLPGIHPVGGLGACTLVRRGVLEAGVRFASLPNLSWVGEDRHFCIRAAAHGFSLWADTHVPPVHLYRESDFDHLLVADEAAADAATRWSQLERLRAHAADACGQMGAELVERLRGPDRAALAEAMRTHGDAAISVRPNVVRGVLDRADGAEEATVEVELATESGWRARLDVQVRVDADAIPSRPRRARRERPRLTLTMVLRNEADRYLGEVLERVLPAIDEAILIDDASDDGTTALCQKLFGTLPHEIVRLDRSLFAEEHQLRGLQWRCVQASNPEWVLNLDGDELFEEGAAELLREHLGVEQQLVSFRLFDMWDREHYREDGLWNAHHRWWPFLARADRRILAWHPARAQHCPRWPLEVLCRPSFTSPLRIQHLGWVRPQDRRAKYERYLALDPTGRWGDARHVASILDDSPRLVPWDDCAPRKDACA